MAISMPDLKFKDRKTYFFCLYETAQYLPENLKANGIEPYQYKLLPIANARRQHLIPDNVHVPDKPEEVDWHFDMKAPSLESLCVLISYIDPESLKPYLDAIRFEGLKQAASEFIRMRNALRMPDTATADDLWNEIRRRAADGIPIPESPVYNVENL